jgi:hypothetical protein
MFPPNFNWQSQIPNVKETLLWFYIEWLFFFASILSNCLFLLIRTCVHHKVKVEDIPERLQLPGVDTVACIREVVDTFN